MRESSIFYGSTGIVMWVPVYYGINYDIYTIGTILEKGILPVKDAKKEWKEGYAPNASQFDRSDQVPVVLCYPGEPHSVFESFIKKGISFVISRQRWLEAATTKNTFRQDEGSITRVSPEEIEGIMLPRESLTKKVSELEPRMEQTLILAGRDSTAAALYFEPKVEYILRYLQEDLGYTANYADIREIVDSVKKEEVTDEDGLRKIIEQRALGLNVLMQRHIAAAFAKKLGKRDVRLFDVIQMYNSKRNLPVYDVDTGKEIDMEAVLKEIEQLNVIALSE